MKTEIVVSFNYGGSSMVYRKTIDLPFIPFFGLEIITNDEKEYVIKLENNDYCAAKIYFNLEKQQFEINVKNHWKYPVTDETVDYVVEQFSDWEQVHISNIASLKELMSENARQRKVSPSTW